MDSSRSTGIGVLGVIQIILVTLKLLRLIDFSWWLVFIPTYISLGLFIIGLLLVFVGLLIAEKR